MTAKPTETYLGDGLYAKYDGFAVWLRAPREHDDHVVALEPQVLRQFVEFVFHSLPDARVRSVFGNVFPDRSRE